MGFGAFIIICIIVVALAWGGTWALGYIAPGHPAIIDKLIWILAIVIIVITLLNATGLMSYDPQIPRVR
jgi:hypothetical protein